MKKQEGGIRGWLLIILGVFLAVKLALNLWGLVQKGKSVSEVSRELAAAEAENATLKEKMALVTSPEFAEREARDRFGYGREGETIMIIPSVTPDSKAKSNPDVPADEANWRKWVRLYIRI